MFGLRPRKADVIRHWYTLVPDFSASTQDFYKEIEDELKERKVPGLEISRVDFAEGGVLSAKREYLRMTRERLVFDICAAPFGTSFFFSCRFAEIPAVVKLWQLLVVLVGLYIIVALTWNYTNFWTGSLLLVVAFAFIIYLLRNAAAMGLHDVDAMLVKSPVFGPLYERFFRRETYYREDTRLMYCDLVNEVAEAEVEEVTCAKGVKLLEFHDYDPILSELYKPRTVALPRPEPSA
jgi:hypothetical protein